MTHKEALNRIKYYLLGLAMSDKDREAFSIVIPELAESEDERIRKWLIHEIEAIYVTDGIVKNENADKALAWLEKQKEHQFCSDAPKEKSVGGDFYSSHKDKNLDDIAQEYVDGVRKYNPEPTWDLMQTAVCYGYHLAENEQKPAEWSKEEKDKFNSIERLIVNANAHGNYLIGDKEAIDLQHFIRSIVKPTTNLAEWNKEDEKMLEDTILIVKKRDNAYGQDTSREQDWLKDLPHRFNLQPKQEWSEEDVKRLYSIGTQIGFLKGKYSEYQKDIDWLHALAEKMGFHKCKIGEVVTEWKKENIDDKMLSKPKQEWSKEETKDLVHILKVLDDCYIYGKHDLSKTDYDNLTSTLKSLRPSWKPSKEQMTNLLRAEGRLRIEGESVLASKLAELYEQLKKLM